MARNSGHLEPATYSADFTLDPKTNMAAKRTRSGRVDYFRLHNLSSAVLFESKAKNIKTYRKKFEVERIVTKRKAVTVSRSSFCSNLSFHFKIHNHVLTMYLLF